MAERVMHKKAYEEGKITLRQYRILNLLKYGNPKKYREMEKKLGLK